MSNVNVVNLSSNEEESEIDASKPTVIPTALPTSQLSEIQRSKKNISIPPAEKRNWLLHAHYVRKDYVTCKSLIKEQLKETKGQCEYAIYIQAMILRNEGEIQNSLELFQACHMLNPSNPDNLKEVARNLVLLGRHKSAIECYTRAANLSAQDWDICHSLGVCYQFLKDYDKAVEFYKQALLKTEHAVTYEALAQLYMEIDDPDKAMEILKKGVEFAPENIDLLTSLGLMYLKKDNFHRAFELLGQVLTCDPENFKAILAVSSLMQRHDDFDVALNKYRVAAHCVPESAAVWNNIGMCYLGKKKIVAAISCLKRAHYHSPFDWKILYNLSLVHLSTQQYVSAFHFASAAITLKSNYGPLFTLLAVALANLDQPDNAEKAYEQAMSLSPNDLYLMVNYSIFLHNHSKHQQAAKIISAVMAKNTHEKLQEKDKELADVCKKLCATLHLGEKVVAEREEAEKSSKKTSKSVSKIPSTTDTSGFQNGTEKPDRKSRKKAEKAKQITPNESAGSQPTSPRSKLPPLLPPLSSISTPTEKPRPKKREKKEKNLSEAAAVAAP